MARKAAELSGFDHIFDTSIRRSPLEAARERLESLAQTQQRTRVAFRPWALQIPEPKFGKLNFNYFPFQDALYGDDMAYAQEGVVQKCSQVGASAWLIRWALFWPDTRGRTSFYVMPTDDGLKKFSNQRVAPVIRQSDYLRTRVPHGNVNNVFQREIGNGYLNMSGSQSESALETVDADALALDEYDLLVQANVPRAEQRVSGPLSLGLIRRIGFPTVPDYGISKKYNESDKRQWFVKCEHCGEWQALDFWKNVDQKRVLRVCSRCTKPIDVKKGEWIAEFPERDIPGFHLSRLMVPNANIAKIIMQSKLRKPYEITEFHNRTLGLPYVEEGGRLSDEAIQAAQSRGGGYTQGPRDLGYSGDKVVTMGVDVASVRNLHVRISEHVSEHEKKALFIGEVASFDDLVALMEIYRVHIAAIDHLPEGRLARAFAAKFPGRVYVVNYATTVQGDVIKVEEDQRRCSVRRTEAHDSVIHQVRTMRNMLPLDLPENYVEHMKAPVRFVERDEMDKVVVGYRATGPDDFFQAEVYDLVAYELFWLRVAVDEHAREEISTLEDHLEYERSALDPHEGRDTYFPGPESDEYRPGFEDE